MPLPPSSSFFEVLLGRKERIDPIPYDIPTLNRNLKPDLLES